MTPEQHRRAMQAVGDLQEVIREAAGDREGNYLIQIRVTAGADISTWTWDWFWRPFDPGQSGSAVTDSKRRA